MHQLTYTKPDGNLTWTFADGLFRIPPSIARQVGGATIVAVGKHALLVTPDGCRPLSPGPVAAAGSDTSAPRLVWRPAKARPVAAQRAEQTIVATKRPRAVSTRLVVEGGEEHPISGEATLIGRHRACGLRLPDPGASTLHCLVVPTGDGLRILDLQSTNGTYVGRTRVHDVLLQHSALLQIGTTRIQVIVEDGRRRRMGLTSMQMRRISEVVERVAVSDIPVLIQGESGVGKDAIAQQIHVLSGRAGAMVTLNAAAITPTLAASELFGHVRGAFTGADADHQGAFAAADGGTLFLDEVAELPLSTQAELLRVVELGRVRRVGDPCEAAVDVRLIAATHRDLVARVRSGHFREDLFHRICVVPVHVPPLRERLDDLELLARFFLQQEQPPRELTATGLAKLRRHRWPGNIRELRNTLQRSCLLSDSLRLGSADIRLASTACRVSNPDHIFHGQVLKTYTETDGNAVATARALGVHPATVYRHLSDARAGRIRRTPGGQPGNRKQKRSAACS